jgi:PKD repeat protein
VYSSSGTIWNNESYDEETQQSTYSPTSDWHNFSLASSGSVRVFTTGTTDTRGELDSSPASSGGDGGNFLFATSKNAGSHSLLVAGEFEDTQGDYAVFVDIKGANVVPTASFVATPLVGRAPLVVGLDGGGSIDPDGTLASYAWDFDNNGTTDAIGATAVATYANSGTSPLSVTTRLTVTDLAGGTATTTRTVTVYPASSYSVSVDGGTSSLPYQQSGSTVSLVAYAPPIGTQFSQWIVVSGSGTFASSTSSSTSFTVGSAETVVRAVYVTDTTAPTIPTGVNLANISADSINVSWTAATDNVGVTGYEVYRNGVLAGTVSGTATTITQLTGSTVYQITVRAKDAAGNLSAHSQMATAKTWVRVYASSGWISNGESYDEATNTWSYNPSADWHSFSVPAGGEVKAHTRGTTDTRGNLGGLESGSGGDYGNFLITQTRSSGSGWLEVRGEFEDTDGPYEVFVDLKPNTTVAPTALFSATPAVGRAPLAVNFDGTAAFDADGPLAGHAWDFDNNSTTDATGLRTSFTFANNGPSAIASTVKLTVTDLDAVSASTTQVVTIYPATSYGIQVEGGSASVPFQVSGSSVNLVASAPPDGLQFASWSIVSGSGTFGNANAASTTFTLGSADTMVKSTYVADVTAPSTPAGLTHSNLTADSVTVSWSAATDNVAVTGYEVFLNGNLQSVVAGTSTTIWALTPWTDYQIAVRARDAANNTSAMSIPVGAKTWQRLYAASGTLGSGADDWHSFYCPQYGTVRAYTRGSTDTTGYMWGTANGQATSGGESDNFQITATSNSGWTTLSVSGNDGETTGPYDVCVDFYPGGAGILANFTATPSVGRSPLPTSFNGVTSTDSAGAITSYTWDIDNNGTSDATGVTAATTYTNAGSSVLTFTAKLTVVGPSGSALTTRTITVHPASSFSIAVTNGTSSQPFQQSGVTVTLTAVAPPGGGTFQGWTLVSGAGTFANAAVSPTTFTMGTADTVVRAVYGADTTAPTAPTNLNYADRTVRTISLIWQSSSDNIGVSHYLVYRTDSQPTTILAGSTADLTFIDSGLSANTAYSYTVKASDAAGNLSAASSAVNVSTLSTSSADTDGDGLPDVIEGALGSNSAVPGATDPTNQTQLNVHRPLK